jgi:hypothetical protein
MKSIRPIQIFTAGVLTVALGFASAAIAAPGPEQGQTSGPASGTTTTPSTAVQKQNSKPEANTAAGGPGVAGKRGTESGSQPSASDRAKAH